LWLFPPPPVLFFALPFYISFGCCFLFTYQPPFCFMSFFSVLLTVNPLSFSPYPFLLAVTRLFGFVFLVAQLRSLHLDPAFLPLFSPQNFSRYFLSAATFFFFPFYSCSFLIQFRIAIPETVFPNPFAPPLVPCFDGKCFSF